MKNELRFRVMAGATLFALLISATLPLVALAQDETATPTPTSESSATPTSEAATATPEPPAATETPVAPSETPSPTSEAPADTATETPTEDLSASATATLSSETPTATETTTETFTPTVTPTLGVPLQASVFTDASVVWCPASVGTPADGLMGCTFADTDLGTLFTTLAGLDPTVDGVIWVGRAYSGGSDAALDGSTFTNMDLHKLTIKGGWTGVGNAIDTNTPSPINHKLRVDNWNHDAIMSDLQVDAASVGRGLVIETNGNITTTRVSSVDSNGDLGAEFSASGIGNVTITSGTFSNNGADGLSVNATGNIKVTGITAEFNLGSGGYFANNSTPGKTITISNSNFNSNLGGGNGLYVLSLSSITLTNINASSNSGEGAYLDNYLSGAGTGNVIVTTGTFNSNSGIAGLEVSSRGSITVTNITANNNFDSQAVRLSNENAATPKTVTVSGVIEINSNEQDGLVIFSDGLVSLKDVTASYNGIADSSGSGIEVDNSGGTAGVTLSGTTIVSGNYNIGLSVSSRGAVLASNVIANSNILNWGAYISNMSATGAQPVTFTGTNLFNYNSAGLEILSNGAVSLNNISANANTGSYGVEIINHLNSFVSAVKLTGTNSMIENYTHGLSITSLGSVALNNITADDNGQGGASGAGVSVNNSAGSILQSVTMTGVNAMSGNHDTNLVVQSNGTIAISSLTANESETGFGATLTNTFGGDPTSKKPVTLSGTNVLSDNDTNGLYVNSFGAISINNLTASNNGLTSPGGHGAFLVNSAASTPVNVKLSGINTFHGNYNDGLQILTQGLTTANSVTATLNGVASGAGYGAYVDSDSGLGGVTFTGTNVFNNNQTEGLLIDTRGAVTLSNVTASLNTGGHGAHIDNLDAGTAIPKNVTLTGVNTFTTNYEDGLHVETYGDIAVASIYASGNGTSTANGDGADLNNNTGNVLFKKVTLSGTNVLSANLEYGLTVGSDGLITVSNLTASGNGELGGALLDNNDDGLATAGVTLTGTSKFIGNEGTGLQVLTNGPIVASNLTATGNLTSGADGVQLDNDSAATDQKVTLTGANTFSDNFRYGLFVTSKGAVALSSITASGNGDYGVLSSNITATAPQPFTLTGTSSLMDNDGSGLEVASDGPISIANLTASGNGLGGFGRGASLFNDWGGTAQKVALTGVNTFNGNMGQGILIQTYGLITSATKLTANENGDVGIMLSNNIPAPDPNPDPISAITLLGTNIANLNDGNGFYINSFGKVTVNNVTASQNGEVGSGIGLNIKNDWTADPPAVIPSDVKITGTNTFLGNRFEGINVDTFGNISTNNLTSSDSLFGKGADIETLTEGKTVTMTGNNYFNNNYAYGLLVSALGNITVNNINANFNGDVISQKGASIFNDSAATPRTIVMTGTNVFIGNAENGLEVISQGNITLNNVRAHSNGALGAGTGTNIFNAFGGTASVTLTGVNSFRNNETTGLQIDSDGVVIVNKVTIENTMTGDGLWIEDTASAITLMCGTFTNNFGYGYDVTTSGLLKLVGVLSVGNGGNANEVFGTKLVVRNCP